MSSALRAKNAGRGQARDQGRVLLVTDRPAMSTYTSALEKAGFLVVGVTGGTAALVSMRRSRPHLIIADTSLKGLSAGELTRGISLGQEGVPIILVGEEPPTMEHRRSALSSGAFDYFQLPGELELLIARTTQLVALSQQMERLRAEADRDYLTGLANRRRFRKALGHEVERWRRYRLPCALLLVDIDHMKQINDAHGHSAGDVVIRHIASSLIDLSRDNDTAARLGGEEFALLLAGANDAKAVAAAARLLDSISARPLKGIGTVTVSLGVAACPTHAQTERTLYAASDAALYRAKHEGRDRMSIAPAVGGPEAAGKS
jgi:diguanylate cyclase (GGDEF)-like protein